MKRLMLSLVCRLLLCAGMLARSAGGASLPPNPDEQLLSEQKHFVECLSCVYSPAWWLSYHESLYFQPRNEAHVKQLEAMKAARSRYLTLTNQEARHELTAGLIAASGIGQSWQQKILLPLSATNQNPVPMWQPVEIRPGETVRSGPAHNGARCYLCVRGGLDVPLVMGSASVHVMTDRK